LPSFTEKKPLVSVVIPTYNRLHTINRAVQSVISQTYGNLEIIIVDDGSLDNTGSFIKNINDNRIIYIRQQQGIVELKFQKEITLPFLILMTNGCPKKPLYNLEGY